MPTTDLYSDAEPESAPAPAAPEEEMAAEETETTAADETTAELPKSILGGKEFKPGEEVVLEIVQVTENSVIVKYASEEGGYAEPESPETAPEAAPGPMAAMME